MAGSLALDQSGSMGLNAAMKSVKITELKNHLSEHLRKVEAGAEIVVTDRDRPIARIVPHRPAAQRARIIAPSRAFASVRDRRFARARWKSTSTELLLEEGKQR